MQDIIKHKIVVPEELSLEQLQRQIEIGGKFIIYEYCISLFFAVSLQRFSPAFFIPVGEPQTKYKRKYDTLSSIFGWWAIPWGISKTLNGFKVNKGGGIDVTDDILLNLNEESLKQGVVEIHTTKSLFISPDKWDTAALNKTIKKDFSHNPNIRKIVVGLFVNSGDYEPHLVVGIDTKLDYDMACEDVNASLRREFRKDIYFEFIDLSTPSEEGVILVEQGVQFA